MNLDAGKAITAGMRADRHRDFENACWGRWGISNINIIKAWLWWGWSITGSKSDLGFPGYEFGDFPRTYRPYHSSNKWVNQ